MWSGFSSEIETKQNSTRKKYCSCVACGAASHLRLKRFIRKVLGSTKYRRMWSGFSSEIETGRQRGIVRIITYCRMWSGFSSEIETYSFMQECLGEDVSHVERLLI